MTAAQASVSAVPRDFFCEHSRSKSRVLVLLAHPAGPTCLQTVLTCRDALLAQHAALLLSLSALHGALTPRQQATAHKVVTALPDAPAASFRQALERARAGVWPTNASAIFTWPADDPLDRVHEDGQEEEVPVSGTRSPGDARLADLPGPVVRVVQLREFHVYDQAKALNAAAACGWQPLPDEELGEDDPDDLVGAVMFAAETTGELPGTDCLTDAQEGHLLLSARGDEVADWSAEPVRADFGAGWRLRQVPNPHAAVQRTADAPPACKEPQPDFASLFPRPAACGCEKDDCEKCSWWLTPRTADRLFCALAWLADTAYDDVAELRDRPVIDEDDGTWGFFSRLPRVTWHQGRQWRRGVARACDDLAGDLARGQWPQPTCAAEEMVLHLALDDAPDGAEFAEDSPSHTTLPTHRDDYDFDACSELFFPDHDVLRLYDRRHSDTPEATVSSQESCPIPAALQPDEWFEDFLNVNPRSPERGFRR
ncbi:hypothetical protein GCM10010206_18110 [Streptomyces cinerochromogenes]|nr:hypothetical protein GCM10010206_18110 [Streptomyces cinerochromogenes]